jgi:hypothetical protein
MIFINLIYLIKTKVKFFLLIKVVYFREFSFKTVDFNVIFEEYKNNHNVITYLISA